MHSKEHPSILLADDRGAQDCDDCRTMMLLYQQSPTLMRNIVTSHCVRDQSWLGCLQLPTASPEGCTKGAFAAVVNRRL